ncbi:MAG: hypothetical protein PSX36_00190 [bacterium]|nr:hypothetical protein [bacterium]
MENEKHTVAGFFKTFAILCNILFFFWILYNGIHENFSGTRIEIISYVALMMLLGLNAFLLYKKS